MKAARRPFRSRTFVHWRVALRSGAPTTLDRPEGPPTMDGFRLIEPPPGHYWADPALVEHAGRTWLFFEDWIYAEERGVIGVAEVLDDGRLGPHQTCLDTGRHLSYPHVFRHGGEHFMIPESGADHEVVLYRATDFPRRWKREHVLQRGLFAVDTTALEHEGRWWFFATVGERPGGEVELLLFSAEALTGEWKAHPASPICSDVLRSRGAGAILTDAGRLVRPSQSCAPVYGHSLLFNEITRLDPRAYAERTYRTIRPTWAPGLIGTHTYNRAGRHEVVDACDLIDAGAALDARRARARQVTGRPRVREATSSLGRLGEGSGGLGRRAGSPLGCPDRSSDATPRHHHRLRRHGRRSRPGRGGAGRRRALARGAAHPRAAGR